MRLQVLCICIAFAIAVATLWSSIQSATAGASFDGNMSMFNPDVAVITVPGLNESIEARPAAFGPASNVSGKLCVVPSLACEPTEALSAAPREAYYQDCIALVLRGGCGFYEKVLNLQEQGALGVIVGDNIPRTSLVTMYNGDVLDNARIPSFFVSFASYQALLDKEDVNITLIPGESYVMDTLLFFLVSPLCSLAIIYGVLVFHRRYRVMKERAPKSYVQKLPTRIWRAVDPDPEEEASQFPAHDGDLVKPVVSDPSSSLNPSLDASNDMLNDEVVHVRPSHEDLEETPKGQDPRQNKNQRQTPSAGHEKRWVSADECAICLEDYVNGVSRVMELPCKHEFHIDCITRWLVSRRKTCPICKHDVTQNVVSENTPLLSC